MVEIDIKRITKWLKSGVKENGKYGLISNDSWLERESDRIQKTGENCEIKIRNLNDGIEKALYYETKIETI